MARHVLVDGGWMWLETCYRCNAPFAMSEELHTAAMERREAFQFYCPNGHGQHYVTGESEKDKLRRERDRLAQRVAEYQEYWQDASKRAEAAERRVSAARGQITKLKKRASNGVCPCCNRTFADLARHMHSKHPGFVQEPDATETVVVN